MNFSRLTPSPPFPRLPAPHAPGTPRCLHSGLGGHCWGTKRGPASLFSHPCSKKPYPEPELPAGEGVCSWVGFSTREANLCFSGEGDSRLKLLIRHSRREEAGFRLGLLGNGYQALFQRAECNLLRHDFCHVLRAYLLVHDGVTSCQVLLVLGCVYFSRYSIQLTHLICLYYIEIIMNLIKTMPQKQLFS